MTMFAIISAIICLIIVFLIMLNMYEYPTYRHDEVERIKVPLYIYIIAVIICITPIVNIVATILYIAWCIYEYNEDDLIIKGPLGKIGNFLNKRL